MRGAQSEEHLDAAQAAGCEGAAYETAMEELALLDEIGADFDMESFLAGRVLAGAVRRGPAELRRLRLLERLCELAPAARAPHRCHQDEPRPVDAPFSGLVFKIQANMDRAHRDRMAFVRVCSAIRAGMVLTHAATGRPFATKYAQASPAKARNVRHRLPR